MANCPLPVPVFVEPHWLTEGLTIAAEQSSPAFGKVALLNYLAMAATRSLLRWLEIPCDYRRDRPSVGLWGVLDFAELDVVMGTRGSDTSATAAPRSSTAPSEDSLSGQLGEQSGGQLLCRPVILPEPPNTLDQEGLVCELPLDLPEEMVACLPVGFDESLQRAWIWGYVPVAEFEVGVRGSRAFRLGEVQWRSLNDLAAELERWSRLSQALATQTELCDRLSALVGPIPLISLVARWPTSAATPALAIETQLLEQYRRHNFETPDWEDRWQGAASDVSTGASTAKTALTDNRDLLKMPFEELIYPPSLPSSDGDEALEEELSDYCVLDEEGDRTTGQRLAPPLPGRVQDTPPSPRYRVDNPKPYEAPAQQVNVNQPPLSDSPAPPPRNAKTPAPSHEPVADQMQAIAQELNQWFQSMDEPSMGEPPINESPGD